MYREFQQTFPCSKSATETPEKGVKVNNKETRASDRHRIGTDKNTSFKSIDIMKPSLREKRSNTELFLVRIFLYLDWIRIFKSAIKSEYRKIRIRNNSVFGHFSRSAWVLVGYRMGNRFHFKMSLIDAFVKSKFKIILLLLPFLYKVKMIEKCTIPGMLPTMTFFDNSFLVSSATIYVSFAHDGCESSLISLVWATSLL